MDTSHHVGFRAVGGLLDSRGKGRGSGKVVLLTDYLPSGIYGLGTQGCIVSRVFTIHFTGEEGDTESRPA